MKEKFHVYYFTIYAQQRSNFWNAHAANILRKSNVILRLHFGNLRKLLSAYVDGT